jgi:cytidyltransferase-like protein
MRRIGVMGGTFDPVHHGHLVAASEVAHIFDLDEVIFVPTGQPYQKDDRRVSPAEDRYLMTVIATASNPRFSRPTPSTPCASWARRPARRTSCSSSPARTRCRRS